MKAKWKHSLATLSLALAAQSAVANPSGPEVVHGSASFAQPNANVLNVTNSHNAIINWQNFNIGQGQTTNFIQPSSASAVLNQVLSNNPSQIHGNLNSNGKVFVINQHGLMIGAGAQINTAGFFGSTLNITNEDFLNGRLKFEGGGFGGIENYGYIHAGDGGNVVLIAPDIANGGVIEVDNGNVILAAGESITITSLNDASVEFEVQSVDDSIINLGDIIANQGAVGLFAGNLKHSGAINATGLVRNADGSISLVAQQDIEVSESASLNADGDQGGNIRVQSHHGDVYFSGNASAQGSSESGGHIEILGDRVGIFGAAEVNASGRNGGGEVLIGGDFQGQGETQTATQTQVSSDAHIHADAIASGDGGKVIVWADDFTLFQGEATARGGSESGDGGFMEISGKGSLSYDGSVDASAVNGDAGSVLFDPLSITIQSGGLSTIITPNPYTFTTNPGLPDTFLPSDITDITNGGTLLTLQADLDIIINDDIITTGGGAGGDITFEAGQSILINADIDTDGGTLKLYANAAGADSTNRSGGGTAQITMLDVPATPITLDAGSGNIELWMDTGVNGNDAAGDITIADLVASHVLIKHNGTTDGGTIVQHAGGLITASSVFVDHDGPTNGSVGSAATPLNLLTSNVGAHIHEATTLGIFIDAQPMVSTVVGAGNTCYGAGSAAGGCDTFGPHGITGLETLNGGDIEFTVGGDINVSRQIQIDDQQSAGLNGDILLSASGSISSNANILNNTTNGPNKSLVDFDSASPIALNSGNYRGLISTSGTGNPLVSGSVVFDGADLDVGTGLTLNSAGTLAFVGDSLFNSQLVVSGGVLDVSGMTLTLNGGLNWNGGANIQGGGSGTLTLQGASSVSGLGIHRFDNVTINNNSVFSLISSLPDDFRIESGSVFSNNVLFDITTDANVFNGGTPASFNNNGGILVKSGGAGNSTIDASIAFTNTAAVIDIQSGELTIASLPTLILDSGSLLLGFGTFNGNLNNGGSVNPGSIGAVGELTINGNFTNNSTGAVIIDILDTVDATAGNEYDLMTVTGQADLDGTLLLSPIDGFTVTEDANIFPLTYNPLVGSFANVFPIGGESVLAAYGPNELDLFLDFAGTGGGFFWTGGGNGLSWNDRLNWSGSVIPTIADDVTIGAFSVSINADAEANSLSLAAGSSLGLSSGTFTTNELVINGVVTVTSGGTLAVQNGGQSQDLVVNAGGALVVDGGNLSNLGDSRFDGAFSQLAGVSSFSGFAAFKGPFGMNGGSLGLGSGADLSGTNNTWSGGSIVGGGQTLLLAGSPGADTLLINGALDKTLDGITLNMNLNDVNVFGDGNLVLANSALIDNSSAALSFNHFGNGDIIGSGTFNNTGGAFNNLAGNTTLAVNLVNSSSSIVGISGGTLVMQVPGGGSDAGIYNIGPAGTLQVDLNRSFTGAINSSGTVHVSNAAVMDVGSLGLTTANLVLSGSSTLTGTAPVTVQSNLFWSGGNITSGMPLVTSAGSTMTVSAPSVTLPTSSSVNGNVNLVGGAVLNLNANPLQLNNGAALAGIGTVTGDVVNNSGFLLTGGLGTLGALNINGNYTQNAPAVMVIEVFNNGFSTQSDLLSVSGTAQLGGTLVIGFVSTSLGLVTSNFEPFSFGSLSGSFDRVIDAGDNILAFNVNGGIFTILGVSPQVPADLVDELIGFLTDKREREKAIKDNRATAERVIEEILDEKDDDEDSLLVCK